VARRVQDPRGGEWIVRRRWLERRRPLYGVGMWTREEGHEAFRQYGIAPWQLLAVFLFVPLLVISAVRTLVELVLSLIAHARGRAWTIEARLDAIKQERLTWHVHGWAESRRAIAETATALSRGYELTSFGEPERGVVGFDPVPT
jgi:hypothetical protein